MGVLRKYYEALVSSLPQETHAKLIFNIKETTLVIVRYSTCWEQREQRETPREMLCSEFIALHKHKHTHRIPN